MTLTTSQQNFHLFKVNNPNIVNVHFSLKTIEYMSCILLPNCLRFRNALETPTSGNCPISKEVCLKFRFCDIFLYLNKACLRFSKKKKVLPKSRTPFCSSLSNIYVCKSSCQYYEISTTWSSAKLIFLQKLSK